MKKSKRRNRNSEKQGRGAYKRYSAWKAPTPEEIKARNRIHTRITILGDSAKLIEFNHKCANHSGFAKDTISVSREDMYKAADRMLREDISHTAKKIWGKSGEQLALEFLEQRAHLTETELVAWRIGKTEINLAGEFLEWVKKEQSEWAQAQKRKKV